MWILWSPQSCINILTTHAKIVVLHEMVSLTHLQVQKLLGSHVSVGGVSSILRRPSLHFLFIVWSLPIPALVIVSSNGEGVQQLVATDSNVALHVPENEVFVIPCVRRRVVHVSDTQVKVRVYRSWRVLQSSSANLVKMMCQQIRNGAWCLSDLIVGSVDLQNTVLDVTSPGGR